MSIAVSREELLAAGRAYVKAEQEQNEAWQAYLKADDGTLEESRVAYSRYQSARRTADSANAAWVTMRSHARMWPDKMTP